MRCENRLRKFCSIRSVKILILSKNFQMSTSKPWLQDLFARSDAPFSEQLNQTREAHRHILAQYKAAPYTHGDAQCNKGHKQFRKVTATPFRVFGSYIRFTHTLTHL
eukprot:gnl/MRDRNA2_/MRDRNA2_104359_c0_seq1.p1 gnl/MRDRNA2_/MRDRNA2_104359_c0~~gnl/MRDRNA2_/MRDRNA2_104359_c0_seq1.p1  ORF type:complete len:107 (-),score=1.13 gnl/MRDRNA2_/MRDRNA2_104359_c0_seq1:36-356(-)